MKYVACVSCSTAVGDPFEVGRALGRLIAMNAWAILDESHGVTLNPDKISLGFTTKEEALEACEAIDDLGIVGLESHLEKQNA